MKLAIIFSDTKFAGKLTKLFTGCYAYHIGWVDDDFEEFYDMHLIMRRRKWKEYSKNKDYILYDFPEVHKFYIEHELSTMDKTYGFLDYLLFGLRPIYHLFGKSTRNMHGIICSELINIHLLASGVQTPFKLYYGPPSPCDFYFWLSDSTIPFRMIED